MNDVRADQPRSTIPGGKSKVYAAGSVNPTRQLVLQYIAGVTKNGARSAELRRDGLRHVDAARTGLHRGGADYRMTPETARLRSDTGDGPRSAFRALMVAGVPIFADPYCPEGLIYLVNSNYLNLYVHVNASFAFTGFESTISNWQLGYVGALVTIAELVSVKPKSMGRVGGFNSLTL
jgi:hypothetical protein